MHMSENIRSIRGFGVSADNLIPMQHAGIASRLLRSADCYQQRFIKFDGIGIFHSYAELLHAALLEANPEVSSFTPQPLSLRVGKRRYIPDCYYVKSGKRYVVELKPRGEFVDEMKLLLEAFFQFEGIKFEVIPNESVLESEQVAISWLRIIRVLLSARFEDTTADEVRLWESFKSSQHQYIDEIISNGNRIDSRKREIALFRLLHKGKLKVNFNEKHLGLDSEVSLCN